MGRNHIYRLTFLLVLSFPMIQFPAEQNEPFAAYAEALAHSGESLADRSFGCIEIGKILLPSGKMLATNLARYTVYKSHSGISATEYCAVERLDRIPQDLTDVVQQVRETVAVTFGGQRRKLSRGSERYLTISESVPYDTTLFDSKSTRWGKADKFDTLYSLDKEIPENGSIFDRLDYRLIFEPNRSKKLLGALAKQCVWESATFLNRKCIKGTAAKSDSRIEIVVCPELDFMVLSYLESNTRKSNGFKVTSVNSDRSRITVETSDFVKSKDGTSYKYNLQSELTYYSIKHQDSGKRVEDFKASIPQGIEVRVREKQQIKHVWKDGKVSPSIDKSVIEALKDSKLLKKAGG